MNDKVLIRKQASTGVQQFQTIGGQAPSFMDLYRRVRDPNVGTPQRIGAGLGLAGKVGAGLGTMFTTAHQLQGGNVMAPLGMGYTYQGLDPTAGMRNAVSEEQQIADKVQQMRIQQQAKERFQEMSPSQGPVSRAGYPNRGQRLGAPYGLQDPLAESPQVEPSVVDQAPAAPVDPVTRIAQAVAQMPGMETQSTGSAEPVKPLPNPGNYPLDGTMNNQAILPQGQPPQAEQVVPQGQPYAGYPVNMMNPTTNRPLDQRQYAEWLRQQDPATLRRSFATQVLDEFGDMLHKADPHVAGLLAFKVYMDKVMR